MEKKFIQQMIGGDAKHYLFYGIFVGECLVFALSGALYQRFVNRQKRPLQWFDGLLLALILWLFAGLILLPLSGAGVFGANLDTGISNGLLSLAIVGIVFGLLFVFLQRGIALQTSRRDAERSGTSSLDEHGNLYRTMSRRTLLKNVAIVTGIALAGVVAWRLTVVGQVDNPFTLTYQDLLALPMRQQYESLMCISNEVGGQYMSNAQWEGIPLMDLLQRAGIKAGATKVVFHAADDYSDSIHLAKALEPTTLLAVRMNGVTLPQGHGFPVRMLKPGIYGMKHCKWLTRIEVVNYDYQGYWQQRGWSDPAPVRMAARIDTPLTGSTVTTNRTTYIAGVAFSGNKGISEVDVSTDSGQTWQHAILKQPLSGLTWVLWELAWQPPKAGSYTVVARAIDLEGNVQDPNEEPPLPNGSSGYHSITLNVS